MLLLQLLLKGGGGRGLQNPEVTDVMLVIKGL